MKKVEILVTLFVLFLRLRPSGGQHLICDNRNPEGHAGVKQQGDGTFQIEVTGRHADAGFYAPNEPYTVTIRGLNTRYSVKRFLEFLLVVESEKQVMMGESGLVTTGIFHVVDESLARFSDFCPDGVTNTNHRPKTEISVLWTAPSILVASCITFKATVVERPHVWYMDEGGLTKTLCPFVPVPPSTTTAPPPPALVEHNVGATSRRTPVPKCCACDEAKYEVAFQGLWSKDTHPKDFPENKYLLHFSDIIGASHDSKFYFWETGQLASDGVRRVAEWGATDVLAKELQAKHRHVNTIIKAHGLWYPNERGQTTAAFRVDKERHLMSLVTMIGPSPDWFVGLSGYNLCLTNCSWLDQVSFDLYPYDAGSDSGVTYMSPNERTVPAQVITRITESNDSRSPFFDPSGHPMKSFAKLHLRRQQVYPKSCDSSSQDPEESHQITISENSEDVGRPECAVTEWSPWSDCSVTCDKGLRMRKRSYVMPPKEGVTCDRQLEEKEMCLGVVPTCDNDERDLDYEEHEGVCAVTRWTPWSPCDRSCGEGRRTRHRRYRDHMGRKKCTVELIQTEVCMGPAQDCDVERTSDESNFIDPECPVTGWSEYSPCSTSCGQGFRERTRYFLISPNSNIPAQCLKMELSQNVTCEGEYGSCELSMEEAKGICMLEPDVGPCRFWKDEFYFSIEKGMCVPIRYGGCKGNRNRFETETECLKVCGFLSRRDLELNEQELTTSAPLPLLPTTRSTHEPVAATSPTPLSLTRPTYEPLTLTRSTYTPLSLITRPTYEPLSLERTTHEPLSLIRPTVRPIVTTAEPTTPRSRPTSRIQPTPPEFQPAMLEMLDQVPGVILNEEDEPVNCVVSKYSEWSICQGDCGDIGYTTRRREIIIEPRDGKYKPAAKCPKQLTKRRECRVKC